MIHFYKLQLAVRMMEDETPEGMLERLALTFQEEGILPEAGCEIGPNLFKVIGVLAYETDRPPTLLGWSDDENTGGKAVQIAENLKRRHLTPFVLVAEPIKFSASVVSLPSKAPEVKELMEAVMSTEPSLGNTYAAAQKVRQKIQS